MSESVIDFEIVEMPARVIVPCSQCNRSLRIPSNKHIKFKCPHCQERMEAKNGVLNEKKTSLGEIAWFTLLGLFCIFGFGIFILMGVQTLSGFFKQNETALKESTTQQIGQPIDSKLNTSSVITYSGNCTYYKRTFVERTKVKYTPIKQAFGKVVIDRSTKKFSFFFDGKLIHSIDRYLSETDNLQGGEGFSLSNGYSAQQLTAEKRFQIFFSPGMGDAGSEYEIVNYRVN